MTDHKSFVFGLGRSRPRKASFDKIGEIVPVEPI